MLAAVIPAYNEEENIQAVLDNLAQLFSLDVVIPVLNGCTDNTRNVVLAHPLVSRLALIEYPLPLGIDVPRSWGAECALKLGADAVLFTDGDLQGDYASCLQDLICETLYRNCDLALTNCYPYIGFRSETARLVLHYREKLNRRLKLFPFIGLATPSHGPHCVSRRLLSTLGTECLSIPPLMLAKAAEAKLNIRVGARLTASQWFSAQRGDMHNQKIADTIIGDCIEALQYVNRQPVTREENGVRYLGYRTPNRYTFESY
ncbi:MAG: glycosyltransferase [Peptococcaceae bacterium]|nr:glycosyltransferase [Peptococcaceae bacterium]